MKIARISLTGADDKTNISDLLELSRAFPLVEWAILFSQTRAGSGRYPSADFINELHNLQRSGNDRQMNLAAHLCGKTMRNFMQGITFEAYDQGNWVTPHGLDEGSYNWTFQRTQVNFNATREGYTQQHLHAMLRGWYETMDGLLITQHNEANKDVWAWCQSFEHQTTSAVRAHQLLHDASGGRGILENHWNKPIAGVLNGYAGGLGPDNIIDTLRANEDTIGDGVIWIDMEGALRDENDTFDLEKAQSVLDQVTTVGKTRGWLF